MYQSLVAAPVILVIYTMYSSEPFYDDLSSFCAQYLLHVQCHLRERSRLPSRRPTDRAGALPVRIYALPNNLPACCLYHRLNNSEGGDGNTVPIIHRDCAARAP
jgi:hypothetical protein